MKKSISRKVSLNLSVMLITLIFTGSITEITLFILAAAIPRNEFIVVLNKSLYFGKWFHDVMENSDNFEYSKSRIYDLKPGASFNFKNLEYDVKMNFDENRSRVDGNSDSFPALYNNKPENIIFLGDSVTMGWGVDNLRTYASILGNELNLYSLNFGVSSYNTYRELDKGANSNYLDSAKYIVIQYHINDADENSMVVKDGPKEYSENDFNSRMNAVKNTYGSHTGGYYLFDYTFQLFNNIYNKNLKLKNGFRENRDLEIEAKNFFKILKMWPQYNNKSIIIFDGSELIYQDSRFSEVFSQFAEMQGFANVNVININFTSDDYFYYDNHQNNLGHQKIADSIREMLN